MAQHDTSFLGSLWDILQGTGNGLPRKDILTRMPQPHKDTINNFLNTDLIPGNPDADYGNREVPTSIPLAIGQQVGDIASGGGNAWV